MSVLRRLALALPLVLLLPFEAEAQRVALYIPAFEGEDALGRNVATVLNLQIWQTLRKAPFPNPQRISFGEGMVIWDDVPLSSQTHEGAVEAAREFGADMVLWGKAWRYGDGVAVQAYLTIVQRDTRSIWQIQAGSRGSIGVDVPRSRYEFRPIVLSSDVVATYRSPAALKLYETRTSADPIGEVGLSIRAIEQGGDTAKVESRGTVGWVRLPALSRQRSEIVDFVGGVVRALRQDWQGAEQLFSRVVANGRAPTAIKIDAHLYTAVARERSGRAEAAEDALRAAHALNPFDKTVASFRLIGQIVAMTRAGAPDAARANAARTARDLVASTQSLFPPGDAWLKRVTEFLAGER